MTLDDLIIAATDFYLKSRDFNGYPAHHIHRAHELEYGTIKDIFVSLIKDGRGTIIFGDLHPNPHIRAFQDEPSAAQLEKLEKLKIEHSCLYPSANYLSSVVKSADYQDRPFTLELALGAGQLEFRSFDLTVLEGYRNDPRYHYDNDDIRGKICITDEFYESDQIHEKDQIILETFGFAYDGDMNRAVAAFLIYLNRLSPEHQQTWNSKRLEGNFKLHPDYYRNCILGDWGSGISVFDAFVEELEIINRMCDVMGHPPLFRETFKDNRPRNFSFLVRPTQEEFNDFILTLDKMMSDNINKKFFMNQVSDEIEEEREDGKIVVRNKGTIAMFDEWIRARFHPADPVPLDNMIIALKKVRKLRQKPAHAVKPNIFDQRFFHEQRQLIIDAYTGIRTIRLLFAGHPAVRRADIEVPKLLYEGKIWTQ